MADHVISMLDWAGKSPDINPIENLWSIMVVKINNWKPSSPKPLIKHLEKAWHEVIAIKHLQSLVKSMPDRIAEVIRRRRANQILKYFLGKT